MPGPEEVAVQLGVRAARVVSDKGELGIRRSSDGE